MGKRAEPGLSPRGRRGAPPPRFEFDRAWLLRGLLAALAIGLVLLILKVSTMAFSGAGKRLDRFDPGRASTSEAAAAPAREAGRP